MGVNVIPGAVIPGTDPEELLTASLAGLAPDEVPQPIQLNGTDLDGNFVPLPGLMAVDEGRQVAVAVAAGPDLSSRIILITGDVSEELLRDVVGLVRFTGVGAGAG
jgi:hypothetical protein